MWGGCVGAGVEGKARKTRGGGVVIDIMLF